MQKILRLFTSYVVAFMLISTVCGLVYASVQQVLRQGANDPQIQIAEDAVIAVKAGQTPTFSADKIDLSKSIDVFLAIYDKDGNPLDSNASLNNELPKPPKGIFDTAKNRGQYRVTWKPQAGVRQALVVSAVGDEAGQFVAVGRSLRDVEDRENQTLLMATAAWVIMMVISFTAISVFSLSKKDEEPSSFDDITIKPQ